MQENEFEDELGKNMEGFGIEPSAKVWPEVERRIRKEKKHRYAFWIWFLLLLLGGGLATAILFNQGNKNNNTIATTQTEENINNPISSTLKKEGSINKGNTTDVKEIIGGIQNKQEDVINEIISVPATVDKILSTNSSSPKQKKSTYKKTDSVKAAMANKIEYQTEIKQTQENITTTTVKPPENVTELATVPKEKSIINNLKNESDTIKFEEDKLKDLIFSDAKSNELAITDSSTNLSKKDRSNQKLSNWKWGVQFSAGKSGFSKNIFSLNNAMNADLSYSSPGAGSGTVGTPLPSAIKPSLAFSAGWFIKKSISKKLDLSIGINYQYLSTHRSIGSRVDSTREVNNNSPNKALVTEFFRPAAVGNSNNYTSQFHFIGLQADIALEIIAAKKFTLYWENGIAYNRLVNSNMLHYSNSLPGYYKDNSLLNKNQISFSTGLLLPIGDRFMIKPFLNYNLSKVFKKYATSNPHFSTYGLQLKYIFKK